MLVRLPSAACYAAQVEKEQLWLPKLAPLLPLSIPAPLTVGEPGEEYPWKWSIYRWLPGESASHAPITNLCDFATSLAQFLTSLHHIDATDGPAAGSHSFYRGGSLKVYDAEVRRAIEILKDKIDTKAALELWEAAVQTTWHGPLVWVHGDISTGNLLVKDGRLSAVIDFGQLAVGDPACDLAITWTLFEGQSRDTFRKLLPFDKDTWCRARVWVLWKFMIVAAGMTQWNAAESQQSWKIINAILEDHQSLG